MDSLPQEAPLATVIPIRFPKPLRFQDQVSQVKKYNVTGGIIRVIAVESHVLTLQKDWSYLVQKVHERLVFDESEAVPQWRSDRPQFVSLGHAVRVGLGEKADLTFSDSGTKQAITLKYIKKFRRGEKSESP